MQPIKMVILGMVYDCFTYIIHVYTIHKNGDDLKMVQMAWGESHIIIYTPFTTREIAMIANV
jgi:hypothetical protein